MQAKFLTEEQHRVPYLSVGNRPLASLVVLSFNRPEFLHKTIASLKHQTHYPYELIVVDDGSMHPDCAPFLYELYKARELSLLILNPGRNQGVGASMNKAFHASHGKYLLKLDADLEFTPDWLTKVVAIMETFPEIGCLGLFHYHWVPCTWQDMIIRVEERDGLKIEVHEDFVGSTMVFSREIYSKFGDLIEGSSCFGEDREYKMALKEAGYWLALPSEDLVDNIGFGLNTTSLLWKGREVGCSKTPLIFE